MAVLHRGRLQAVGRPDELGARLWAGLAVDLDLGGSADEHTLAILRTAKGVLSAEPAPDGARVRVDSRETIPVLVATLVAHEVKVFGTVPRPPTVEDVYFALQERRGASQ